MPEPTSRQDVLDLELRDKVLSALINEVKQLSAEVKSIRRQIDTRAKPTGTGGPVDWANLDGDRFRDTWNGLGVFVDGLVRRFGLQNEILPCWWQHGEVIEELSALWTARSVAFAPNADPSLSSWWLDLLERIRMRLRSILITCRHGHVAPEESPWMSDDDWARFRSYGERT